MVVPLASSLAQSSRFDDLKRFSSLSYVSWNFLTSRWPPPSPCRDKKWLLRSNSCFYKRELLYFLVNYTIREESSRAEQQTVVAFFEVQPELKPNLSNYILGQFFSTFGPHKYEEWMLLEGPFALLFSLFGRSPSRSKVGSFNQKCLNWE